MWGCFLMSGVKILHFLKDWWKSIPMHQNYTMALKGKSGTGLLEERAKKFRTKQWKVDENWLKNKEVEVLQISQNIDMNICKWVDDVIASLLATYFVHKIWIFYYFVQTCDSMSLISRYVAFNIILHLFREESRQV